jgi:PAS domain-containing serine/threonine kinase
MFAVLLDLLLRPFTKTHSILKDIGSGSFGTVLLTRNKVDNKLYVAKFIKRRKVKELVPDSAAGEDVPLEIYLLSRLNHPNIVSCVGCYKLPQHWVLTMKYLDSYTDLKTLIKLHGRLSETMSRTILIQTYDALVYCLSVGVDHRDVKHQNILVHQTNLQIKLIDFGLSSICDSKTVYTSVQGTELFLPPEAVVQRRYTPLEASSWALGCLLYCMVCGRAPFSSKREVVFSEPELPSCLSPFCVDLLTQCLNKVRHLRVRFENLRWHTWMNLDRYRNFLESTCLNSNSGTVNSAASRGYSRSQIASSFSYSPNSGLNQSYCESWYGREFLPATS